jgi:hypothetical protein
MTENQETVVHLAGGLLVPRRFRRYLMTRPRGEHYEVEVEMIGGRQHLRRLVIEPAGGKRTISPKQLSAIDLVDVLDAAVQHEALDHSGAAARYWSEPVVTPESAAAVNDALDAATMTRRRRITPDVLAEVVELYKRGGEIYKGDGGGVRLVIERLGYSERNVRRLLARAREAGLM